MQLQTVMEDEDDVGKIIGPVQIGELFYLLDTCDQSAGGDRTARVDYQTYWDEYDNYPNLVSVVIPETIIYDDEEYRVVSIGYAAFAFCSRLTFVVLSKTLRKIEESAFWGCSSLTSIVVPEGVTVIEKNAFYDCPNLATIVLPDSLISIGDYAFVDSEITSIRFPDSITEIGAYVFGNSLIPIYNAHLFAKLPHSCSGEYIVPEGIRTIAKDAFGHYVDEPFSVILPPSVTYIGDQAFRNRGELLSLTCKAIIPPALGDDVFNLHFCVSIPIYVPAESIELYKAAPQWQQLNIHPIPYSK